MRRSSRTDLTAPITSTTTDQEGLSLSLLNHSHIIYNIKSSTNKVITRQREKKEAEKAWGVSTFSSIRARVPDKNRCKKNRREAFLILFSQLKSSHHGDQFDTRKSFSLEKFLRSAEKCVRVKKHVFQKAQRDEFLF